LPAQLTVGAFNWLFQYADIFWLCRALFPSSRCNYCRYLLYRGMARLSWLQWHG